MAQILIRQLEDDTKAKLQRLARQHGRSTEEEAREILRASLSVVESEESGLAESIRKRFAPFHGVELRIAKREEMRKPSRFSE